jgi:hypothetical protein
MTWIVGRDDAACYVEEGEPLKIGGMPTGEQGFDRELDAVRYALMCEEDAIGPLRRSISALRRRLRKLERTAAIRDRQLGERNDA